MGKQCFEFCYLKDKKEVNKIHEDIYAFAHIRDCVCCFKNCKEKIIGITVNAEIMVNHQVSVYQRRIYE